MEKKKGKMRKRKNSKKKEISSAAVQQHTFDMCAFSQQLA